MHKLIENYKSYLENNRGFTGDTVRKYSQNVALIIDKLKITSVHEFTSRNINEAWYSAFWAALQTGHKLSDASRQNYLSSLKSFLRYLELYGKIEKGIADKITLPKVTEKHYQGLTKAEQKALREYLSTHLRTDTERRDAALIYFMWATACRISEALALNVHGDGMIYTDNLLQRSGDFQVTKEGKKAYIYVHINGKNKKNRNIVVSPEAIAYLNFYLENRKQKSSILFMSHAHNPQRNKGRLLRVGAYGAVAKVFARVGIETKEQVVTHILRHTAIDTWIDMGIPTKQIITMTGHASEMGLEPYYRRRKELTNIFADEANVLAINELSKNVNKFEILLKSRYVKL